MTALPQIRIVRKKSFSRFWSFLTLGDKILVGLVLVVAAASFGTTHLLRDVGSQVLIESNGKLFGKYDLFGKETIVVHGAIGATVVRIQDGRVRVVQSDCREKICVNTGQVQKSGDTIVCVPNRVVVRIVGGNSKKIDLITG